MRPICPVKITSIFILFFCSTLAIVSALADTTANVAQQGVTTVSDKFHNEPVKISIRTHSLEVGKPSDPYIEPEERTNNCTYSHMPCSLVENLKIQIGTRQLFVPRSAFADLSDVFRIQLKIQSGQMVLIMKGGDAGEAYEAAIFFDAARVLRRRIKTSEMDRLTEQTIYSK